MLFLLLAAVFALVVPRPELSISSTTHASPDHSDAPSTLGEYSPLAAADGWNKAQEAAPEKLEEKVPGPGAFLGTLLRLLAAASNESDAGIKKLVAGLPHVLPDLNKVLVAL